MTRALIVALILAGCARQQAAAPADPVRAGCATQAENDPDVQRILMIGAGQPSYYAEHQMDLSKARHAAEQKCLQAHGLAPPGGVAAPRRDWYDTIF